MMNEFIKSGNKVYTKPSGVDYTLESGVTYNLKYDDWEGLMYLELANNIKLPENYFYSDPDKNFVSKVLTYFNATVKNTTGIMLKGLKGSGKSMLAKKIAIESNLPIIVVDPGFPARRLNEFFNKFSQDVVILFDELEKNKKYWDSDKLLSFLDGISATCKKLVIFTCNSDDDICEFIKDRCSRVRYCRTFDAMSEEAVFGLCNREIDDEGEARAACAFIMKTFKTISFDNVLSFIEEVKMDSHATYEDLMKDLNIYKK
jgi:SpoVK/Ycf46/Vps4 family AAA+-type ATPase